MPRMPRGGEIHGTLIALSSREALTLTALLQRLAQTQVIALGEEHHHPAIQAFALRLLHALNQHQPHTVALAMEFLERDMQPAVDAYLAGTIDDAAFLEQIKASPEFRRDYFPLVQYARHARLPVLAMNIPRQIARRVVQEGLEPTLARLSATERAWLPPTLTTTPAPYRTYFLEQVSSAHPLPAERVESFVAAAYLKDVTMAATLAAWLERTPDTTILAISGRFHTDYGLAIPHLLQQMRPQTRIQRLTTLTVAADEVVDLARLAHDGLADYLWSTAPQPTSQ